MLDESVAVVDVWCVAFLLPLYSSPPTKTCFVRTDWFLCSDLFERPVWKPDSSELRNQARQSSPLSLFDYHTQYLRGRWCSLQRMWLRTKVEDDLPGGIGGVIFFMEELVIKMPNFGFSMFHVLDRFPPIFCTLFSVFLKLYATFHRAKNYLGAVKLAGLHPRNNKTHQRFFSCTQIVFQNLVCRKTTSNLYFILRIQYKVCFIYCIYLLNIYCRFV